MQKIRCARCETYNDSFLLYCNVCGEYLHRKNAQVQVIDVAQPAKKTEYYAVCSQCGKRIETTKDELPFMCPDCGYVFLMGIDVVQSSDGADRASGSNTLSPGQTTVTQGSSAADQTVSETRNTRSALPSRRGALPSARRTETALRLLALSIPMAPVDLRAEGNFLGKNGMLGAIAGVPHRVFVWRAATGSWYIRLEEGKPLLNGEYMQKNYERRLEDGDTVTLDAYSFRVEILQL